MVGLRVACVAGLALAWLWAGDAAAGPRASLTLENHSSRRIEGVSLGNSLNPRAEGWTVAGFRAERDGGEVELKWLTPHMTGRAVMPKAKRCVFDVTVTVENGAVHRRGLDLCKGQHLVIDDKAIEYPDIPTVPPPPPILIPTGPGHPIPPSPPLTALDSGAWTLLGTAPGGRYFLDPGSITGGPGDRQATVKFETQRWTQVRRYRARCDTWRLIALSDITYDAEGRQTDSMDRAALGAVGYRALTGPIPIQYGSPEDIFAVRLCQGVFARLR